MENSKSLLSGSTTRDRAPFVYYATKLLDNNNDDSSKEPNAQL
jgi:hypothetical protein